MPGAGDANETPVVMSLPLSFAENRGEAQRVEGPRGSKGRTQESRWGGAGGLNL